MKKRKWFKSSYSGGGENCVEVRFEGGLIYLRNSKQPDAGTAVFTPTEWQAFLLGARDGEFDL